jgi:hypothetical protein
VFFKRLSSLKKILLSAVENKLTALKYRRK